MSISPIDGRAAYSARHACPACASARSAIGSAGKMFSLTGWKVGWLTGPRALISVIAKAHQFLTFTTSPALQLGIAHGLRARNGIPPSRLPGGFRTIAIFSPPA